MGLVYSTEAGRMCPACRQPAVACRCQVLAAAARPAGDGVARVSREKQGRAGKLVTVVRGLPLPPAELQALGKQLRAACGAGGTVKDGALEIQGDHAERIQQLLTQQGLRARRTGG
jgi:translation initiation factor 1